MRKHRYVRGGYRAGNVKKSRKKLIIRITFVLVCALVLTVFSVLLGTYLNKKAENSLALSTQSSETEVTAEDIGELFPDGIPVKDPEESKRELCAADIDITAADADTLCGMIDDLSDQYNAVSVRITSENGKLIYISPALMEYVGLDHSLTGTKASTSDNDKAVDTFLKLKAVINKAKAKGLRVVALFTTDSSSLELNAAALSKCEIDSVIAGELAALGCDEILIDRLFTEAGQIPHETLKSMVRYLAVLRSRTEGVTLGLNFPDNIYLIPQNASIIKTLSEYADFLAITVSTPMNDAAEAYHAVYDTFYSLKGNFSMYNLRGIIDSDDADISCAIHASLKSLSAKSFQFKVYVADPVFRIDGSSDDTETGSETVAVNNNANRKEDYTETESLE